jgi:hypothetical protein
MFALETSIKASLHLPYAFFYASIILRSPLHILSVTHLRNLFLCDEDPLGPSSSLDVGDPAIGS